LEYKSIIAQILEGDKSAERLLFNTLALDLMHFCRRYSKDNHQAKDLFQDCFIRIFEKLPLYKSDRGEFRPWFFTVCRNVILGNLNHSMKKINIQLVETLPDDLLIEDEINSISDQELLDCIRELPSRYQTIINLHIFDKLKHSEIAKLLDIPVSTSRSQYMRAKKSLKSILIKKIPDLYERKLV